MRNLILIPGDQLSHEISSLDDFDSDCDRVWMAENVEESTHVWCHKLRLVFFFSAMRHFRDELADTGKPVAYHALTANQKNDKGQDFREILGDSIQELKPEKLIVTEPGDCRVLDMFQSAAEQAGLELEVRGDSHFYCSIEQFNDWADGRKSLILENFYRWMRAENDVLMEDRRKPVGGQWNFDKDNRAAFSKSGPGEISPVAAFDPDDITSDVINMVEKRFASHPGTLEYFAYPVNRKQALAALDDFVQNRLPDFGSHQDAMWTDTDFLNHSRISAVMNVHLLDPHEVVAAAVEAYHAGNAPINSVEGFVRQVIGWREFVRGNYYREMPEYLELNEMGCNDADVPKSFWNGETEMNCIAQSMQTVLNFAYAHHIQRLMVLGLYAMLLGVHPRKFHEWHMAMYADAIDWVSLPNTLGMSQHGDGGIVGTKPYCASGNYINKMSNYCRTCQFDPKLSVGEKACPMTTLYWDYLDRHHEKLTGNGRMLFQIKNLERKDSKELIEIRAAAKQLKDSIKNG